MCAAAPCNLAAVIPPKRSLDGAPGQTRVGRIWEVAKRPGAEARFPLWVWFSGLKATAPSLSEGVLDALAERRVAGLKRVRRNSVGFSAGSARASFVSVRRVAGLAGGGVEVVGGDDLEGVCGGGLVDEEDGADGA